MRNTTTTVVIAAGVVLAAVIVGLGRTALADLTRGDPILPCTGKGFPQWGCDFQGPHPFGGITVYDVPSTGEVITVTSGELPPPPDKTFAAFLQFDYTLATDYLNELPSHEPVDIFGIKCPDDFTIINDVQSNVGNVTTDGFVICFVAQKADIIAAGFVVQIDWTQVTVPNGTCPWDCGGDNDNNVGIVDFLALLAQWGGPGSCDFDGGGVGINDFLELLANWGACP